MNTMPHRGCLVKGLPSTSRACFASHGTPSSPSRTNRLQHRPSASVEEGAQVEDKGKASKEDLKAAEEAGEEMYIGFDKKDTEPRKGRKGRVVKGRPEDYPERTDFTGGWAGGEKGLQEFIKKYEEQDKKYAEKAKVIGYEEKDGEKKAKAVTADGEQIYIGFGKTDKRLGQPGQFVTDDPKRYPDKEDVGIFPSITGGFAGGEKGVQQFAQTGDIKFQEGKSGEFSPVVLAGIVALGVSTGALLLNSGVVLTEQAFEPNAPASETISPISIPGFGDLENKVVISKDTKKLLNVALGVLGVSTLILGARTVSTRLQKSSVQLKEDAVNVGKISLFWVTVMIGVLYVVNY